MWANGGRKGLVVGRFDKLDGFLEAVNVSFRNKCILLVNYFLTRDFISDENVFQLASGRHSGVVMADSQRSQNPEILVAVLEFERSTGDWQYSRVSECT